MDPLKLPFDTQEILDGLRPWIECESPTWDAAAVNRMMDLAAYDLAGLGQVERIPGRMGFGGSLRARLHHPDQGRVPGILISGHLDTVHPIGTLDVLPFGVEGDICYGPGIMDMKGGNYVCVEALRQLLKAGAQTPLPVTILFTPDEEVGTPSTRELIEAEARRNKYVLVPEPARAGRRMHHRALCHRAVQSCARRASPAMPARGSPKGPPRSTRWPAGSSRSKR